MEANPHSLPHAGVGGDMISPGSSADLVFWAHHAYMDKLYHIWQTQHTNSEQFADLNQTLPGYDMKVKDVLWINDLCYSYSSGSGAGSMRTSNSINTNNINPSVTGKNDQINSNSTDICDPFDRSNRTCTRQVRKMSDEQIQKLGLNHESVRSVENYLDNFIKGINEAGIVSKTAISDAFDSTINLLGNGKSIVLSGQLFNRKEFIPYLIAAKKALLGI